MVSISTTTVRLELLLLLLAGVGVLVIDFAAATISVINDAELDHFTTTFLPKAIELLQRVKEHVSQPRSIKNPSEVQQEPAAGTSTTELPTTAKLHTEVEKLANELQPVDNWLYARLYTLYNQDELGVPMLKVKGRLLAEKRMKLNEPVCTARALLAEWDLQYQGYYAHAASAEKVTLDNIIAKAQAFIVASESAAVGGDAHTAREQHAESFIQLLKSQQRMLDVRRWRVDFSPHAVTAEDPSTKVDPLSIPELDGQLEEIGGLWGKLDKIVKLKAT